MRPSDEGKTPVDDQEDGSKDRYSRTVNYTSTGTREDGEFIIIGSLV